MPVVGGDGVGGVCYFGRWVFATYSETELHGWAWDNCNGDYGLYDR